MVLEVYRMKIGSIVRSGLALAFSLAAATTAVSGTQAGVGFNPQAVGQTTSRYYIQSPTTGAWSERDAAINFSVTDPLSSATEFERRWGPGSYTRKRWLGPDNELTLSVEQAMIWAFQNQPDLLGVTSPGGWSGQPTRVEVLDACATGYGTAIVVAYAKATWPGASPDRRQAVVDFDKPNGDYQEQNTYWPVTMYYHNRFVRFLPISPQVPELDSWQGN
jgi:hypothetical protein